MQISDLDREPKRARATTSTATAPSSSVTSSSVEKIEISEDHLYGPFNFSAHRPEASKIARQKSKYRQKVKFRVRDDLNIDDTTSGASTSTSKTPPLIDLGGTPPPPTLVDLSHPDQHEIQELVTWLCGMFPDTPKRFIEEQAEDLVGKPAALDRLDFLSTISCIKV